MCQNNPKILTRKDFYNAFYQSEIKDSQTRTPIRSLMLGEAMEIASQIAYDLYADALGLPRGFICLTERIAEFQDALARGFDQEFEVFEGWNKDTFFVKNKTPNTKFFKVNDTAFTEYQVELTTFDDKSFAKCGCPDFVFRERLCKHIAQVLLARMFGKPILQKQKVETNHFQGVGV